MRSMIFDTQGTGFYKRAARQMMAQKDIPYLSGGLGDEIMLLEGLDDLAAAYPHGYDDGPARTYTMPTMDRGTLYDFSTGPVETGISGAHLGAPIAANQNAWRQDDSFHYTGLGAQPGWPAQPDRYMRPTMRFTGPSRTPSRLRMRVEAAKIRLRNLMDESELSNFRATAAFLAEQATGSRFWTAAIDTLAFLEIASERYRDSAWLRGNATNLFNAISSDSNARTRAALGRIAAGAGTFRPASVSGFGQVNIDRGRYAYTGLNALGDAQSDARMAMAIANSTLAVCRLACGAVQNAGERTTCQNGCQAAFETARAAIVAAYGTDGTTPARGPGPSAAEQAAIDAALNRQADRSGVDRPIAEDNTMLYVGGAIAVVAILAGAYIIAK